MRFMVELDELDVGFLQSAVENMRSAPDGEAQRSRIVEARWRLAFEIERIAIAADAARRAAESAIPNLGRMP